MHRAHQIESAAVATSLLTAILGFSDCLWECVLKMARKSSPEECGQGAGHIAQQGGLACSGRGGVWAVSAGECSSTRRQHARRSIGISRSACAAQKVASCSSNSPTPGGPSSSRDGETKSPASGLPALASQISKDCKREHLQSAMQEEQGRATWQLGWGRTQQGAALPVQSAWGWPAESAASISSTNRATPAPSKL